MTDTAQPAPLAPLLAVNFVGTLGFSIVTPFLVVLVTNWGGNAVLYGLLAATYSLFQLFGAPILGRMSDRVGRRRVLVWSQLGTLLSWGLFLIAFTLPATQVLNVEGGVLGSFVLTLPLIVLFIARAADGLTGGNVSVANAYLADITSDDDRTRNFGRMAVSGNLGFVIGPALAGLLGATIYGEVLPVIAAFAISAVALVLIRFGLTDIPPAPIEDQIEEASACDLYGQEHKSSYAIEHEAKHGFSGILALPNLRALMSVNFLVMLGFSFYYIAFPVHAIAALEWDVTRLGLYFAALSIVMIVVQGPVLSRVSSLLSERTLMFSGGSILALGFAALLSDAPMLVNASALLVATGNGLMWPTFMAVLSKSSDKSQQGAVQGYAQSGAAIASISGLVAGGLLYEAIGGMLFLLAAVTIFVSALMASAINVEKPA